MLVIVVLLHCLESAARRTQYVNRHARRPCCCAGEYFTFGLYLWLRGNDSVRTSKHYEGSRKASLAIQQTKVPGEYQHYYFIHQSARALALQQLWGLYS